MNHPSQRVLRSFSSIAPLVAVMCAAAAASAQAQPPAANSPPTAPSAATTNSQSFPPQSPAPEPGIESATPTAAAAAPAAPPVDKKWFDKIKLGGFVDAYASVNYNAPKPQSGQNVGRAFDTSNGFALHWVGLNASYDPEPVGGTVSLRFGPGAYLYNGTYDLGMGTAFVKQAFVSWKPGGGIVTVDVGKFDTWIGAEVADSQLNMNYTRSFLFAGQSLFHTGLRVDLAVSEQFDLKVFAVNGWNNTADNNAGKTFGGSLGFVPAKSFSASVNWIGGPEQSDTVTSATGELAAVDGANSRWRHLVDLVLDLHPEGVHAIVNADVGNEAMPPAAGADAKRTTWYGGNLSLGYAFSDLLSAAVRGGYFKDPDGWAMSQIVGVAAAAGHDSDWIDGTVTLAVSPTPNLMIKLDGRVDHANIDQVEGVFPKSLTATPNTPTKTLVTTTLGVVATTN